MARQALAIPVLLFLLISLPAVAVAFKEDPATTQRVVVEQDGLKLYPRFNKSMKPLGLLKQGQELIVLRELKSWKQVQLKDSETKGWILVKVNTKSEKIGKKFDTVAAPATTGLVARGWSSNYAETHGADFSCVQNLKDRNIDVDRFTRFLEGGDL